FGAKNLKTIKARISSTTGGKLLVRTGGLNGTVIAGIKVPKSREWMDVSAPLKDTPAGVLDLFVALDGKGVVEIDWITFAK
ncbi:MAG: carbohydrate-binding protein, partial [Bacteroidales bacterium]|nr:carbohydrate-binding protein [Bacteroidales bacterium]